MQITLKLFVSLAPFLPKEAVRNAVAIEVDPADSVHAVIDRYRVPRESAHLILINGAYVQPADRDRPIFQPGDVLAIWPPVAGG
jgi:molybdopterin converting factor small subunit